MTLAVAHSRGWLDYEQRSCRYWPEFARHGKEMHGFYDECLMGEVRFSPGFMKPSPLWPFGNEGSFGSPGAGGSLGFADPKAGLGYAYVTNQIETTLIGDPRDLALRNAVYSIIQPAI
jgi:CubicO group peptidase (beta-lactamase class C family)